jgi:hypothetical protein
MATNISLSPSFPGYGESLTGKFTLVRMELLGVDAYPIASSSDAVIYEFRPILGMNSLECFYDGGYQFISIVSSTITDESAVTTVSDPSSVISSTAFEDVGLNRGLRIYTTANSGTAQLEWTWDSVSITLDISVS